MHRYLIERLKAGTKTHYILQIVEAPRMREAALMVARDFAPGDCIRLTLLSVSLSAKMEADTTFTPIVE